MVDVEVDPLQNTENEEINEETEPQNEVQTQKKGRKFYAKEFRQQLLSNSSLNAVKEFVRLCYYESSSQDYALEYLESGGGCIELVRVIESSENKSAAYVLPVFEALTIVLLKIISCHPQKQVNGEESCRELLNKHYSIIKSMLALSSNSIQRKAALKLFATMVTLSPKLAKEILAQVFFDPNCLEVLTNPSNVEDGSSVRTSFIHFIISFLIEGNSDVIHILLQRPLLLQSIFSGLTFDTPDLINVVLSTLKENILLNADLKKTDKMSIFSQQIIQKLINLYNWQGPKNWNPNRKKQPIFNDPDSKQLVCEITHEFLIILCTTKHGIIFRNNNILLSNVVKNLRKPWNNKFSSDLVIKICTACPDLIKDVMVDIESSLETRVSQNWLNVVRFIKQIIENSNPDDVKQFLLKLSVKQLFTSIQTFCAPQSVLNIISTGAVAHENIGIRHESILLVLTMLNSLEKYLNMINNLTTISFENKEFLNITLNNYLNKNLPSSSTILKHWRKMDTSTSKDDSIIPQPEYHIHLTLLLDVLYKYKLICPELVDQITKEIDISEFLKTTEQSGTGNVDIQIKAINLLFICDSSKFHPSQEIFTYSFELLLKLYYEKRDDLIESILSNILSVTGLFEGCTDEISIFLYSVLELDSYDEDFGRYLATVFRDTSENFFKYNKELGSLCSVEYNPTFSIANWLENRNKNINKSVDLNVKHKSLSPLVIGLLNGLLNSENTEISKNVNKILIHLLFSQTCPNILITLFLQDKYKDVCSKNLIKYCKNFDDISSFKSLKKMFNSESIFNVILNSDETTLDLSNISWHPYYSILLTNTIIYYYTQSVCHQNLQQEIQKKCLQVILHIINNSNDNKLLQNCLNSILRHPVLLHNFSASLDNKQTIENMCTEFVFQTIEELLKTKTKDDLEIYLDAFRVKLVRNICNILQNDHSNHDTNKLMSIINLFDFTFEQSTEILKIISELPPTSIFSGNSIVPEILSYIFSKNYVHLNPFDDEIIRNITRSIQKLTNINEAHFDEFINSLCCYINKFPHINKHFDPELFINLITHSSINKSTIKLATVLLKYNKDLIKQFELNFDDIIDKRELIFSLLSSIKDLESAENILSKVYQKYEQIILKFINKPQKVPNYLIENYLVIDKLVDSNMSTETCNTISKKIQKFDVTELYHSQVLMTVFNKSLKSETETLKKNNLASNFVTTMINLLINALKKVEKTDKDWTKINNISKEFSTYLIKITSLYKINYNCENIYKSAAFQNFSKLCLKYGLQGNLTLIKLLQNICSLSNKQKNVDALAILFEMAISHSESLNILLDNSELKAPLLRLLLTICKMCPSVMNKSHIQIFLGAYGATLSESDQYLLQLLMLYEQADLGFHEYRPYLWGQAAIQHYSLLSGGSNNLWKQAKPKDVLDILNESKIKKTVVNFPRSRELRPDDNLYSDGELDVYDPAFYLPLLSHILAAESPIRWYNVSNRSIINLVIISLTSESKDIRAAACHVLTRFYNHVEASQYARSQRLLWLHVIESICKGTSSLPNLCLSSPVAIFLCRCTNIFSQPDNLLYKPLGKYFTAKDCPNFKVVPELLEMMFNNTVQFRTHRNFILEVIRDGLKSKSDMELVFRSMTFKLIMDLYNSTLSLYANKSVILEIIAAAVAIPLGSQVLINSYSLLSWLQTVLYQIRADQLELLVPFIDILNNLVNSMTIPRLKYYKFKILCILVLAIDTLKDSQIDLSHTVKFVKILYSNYERRPDILTKSQLCDLIKFSSKFVDCNICNYYLKFGADFAQQPILINNDSESLLRYYLELLTLKCIEANKTL